MKSFLVTSIVSILFTSSLALGPTSVTDYLAHNKDCYEGLGPKLSIEDAIVNRCKKPRDCECGKEYQPEPPCNPQVTVGKSLPAIPVPKELTPCGKKTKGHDECSKEHSRPYVVKHLRVREPTPKPVIIEYRTPKYTVATIGAQSAYAAGKEVCH